MFLRQIKSDLDLDCISCKKVWRRGHGRQAVPLPKYGSPLFYDWCKALKVTFPEGTEPRRLHVCQDHFPPGTTDCSTLLPINTTPVEESNTDIEETPILANSEITSESRIDLAEGYSFFYNSTVGWGEYGTAGGEVGTLLSQERDVMEENVTSKVPFI